MKTKKATKFFESLVTNQKWIENSVDMDTSKDKNSDMDKIKTSDSNTDSDTRTSPTKTNKQFASGNTININR